jgi:two-component system, sensor histidine kinase and response regulator
MALDFPQFPYELIPPARTEKIAVTPYWKIKEISSNAWRLVGSNPASLTAGADIRDYLPELVGLEDAIHEIWSGQKTQLKIKSIQRDYHPDTGTELYFDLSIKIQPWEDLGGRELVVILEDITSRTLIEKSLVQYSNSVSLKNHQIETARNYNQQIIDSLLDAVITTSASGKISDVNPAFQQIFGFSPDEFIGKSIGHLIRDSKLIQQLNALALAADTNSTSFMEIECVDRRGMAIALECSCTGIRSESKGMQGYVYMLRDIRDRKASQAKLIQQSQSLDTARQLAQESSQIKSNIIAMISHTAETPAKVISEIMEGLLSSKIDGGDQTTSIKAAQASLREMLNTINQIQALAKLGAKTISIDHHSFDVRDDIQDMLVMFRHLAAGKKIKFSYNVHPSVPRYVQTDAAKIKQVLVNLLENAFKFTHSGFISLDISAKRIDSPTGKDYKLYFTITDTGIGIQPDELSLLFRAFHPVSQVILQHQRMGLGLGISNYLVALLGGTMKADSQYGRGSKFSFTIAAPQVEAPENRQAITAIELAPNSAMHTLS